MWTVVYMAQNEETAKIIEEALKKAGILVKNQPAVKVDLGKTQCYEILVPESEVSEAHSIIIDIGF